MKRFSLSVVIVLLLAGVFDAHADYIDLYNRHYAFAELRGAVEEASGETLRNEFRLDLNGDGADEVFLGVTCGNAGCNYYLFSDAGRDNHKFLGTIALHRLGFEVLKSSSFGFPDILSYWRGNVATGGLTRYEFDGKMYVPIATSSGGSDLYKLLKATPIKESK